MLVDTTNTSNKGPFFDYEKANGAVTIDRNIINSLLFYIFHKDTNIIECFESDLLL